MLSYTVDPGDRIVAIDGAWDEFAARNGAPGLTRESTRPVGPRNLRGLPL